MLKRRVLLAIAALILAGWACRSQPVEDQSNDTLLDTAVAATVTALSPPTTLALPEILPCPVDSTAPAPPQLSGIETLPNQVLTYLNQGGDTQALIQAVQDSQLAPREGVIFSQQDFTGDGLQDVAISVLDGNEQVVVPSGILLVFVCQEGQYQLSYTSPPSVELGVPTVREAQDLTGDQIADLLTTRESCGAHTCFFEVTVLVWGGNALENHFPDITNDMPSPSISVEGPQEDGSYDIVVVANGIGSVGAGPFRQFSRTWSYDRQLQLYQLASSILHDSNFRIHVLHDADQAALDGHLETALDLYNRVILDDSLDDWMTEEGEQPSISAYAKFRRMLTFMQLGQMQAAQAEYTQLQTTYPPASAVFGFVQLAQTVWNEFQSTGDLALACQAAREYAQTHTATILDPLYYGYANKTYVAEDVCPIEN